jgi:hypothetical protein
MDTSVTAKKLKWPEAGPGDPTKFRLYYPPAKAPRKALHWDNWLRSMMMDTRFTGTERSILTAIAMHYNLKTGDCFPAHGRVAIEAGFAEGETGETGRKAVQRAVQKAAELGWMRRTFRRGGKPGKNQTNLYELTLPRSVRDGLNDSGPELAVREIHGGWEVIQAADGIAICGPFKTKAAAETWVTEHGPRERRDKIDVRRDISPPHNRELIEQSIRGEFDERTRLLAREAANNLKPRNWRERSKRTPEGHLIIPTGYRLEDLELVRDIIAEKPLTVASVIQRARDRGTIIDGSAIVHMIEDRRLEWDGISQLSMSEG